MSFRVAYGRLAALRMLGVADDSHFNIGNLPGILTPEQLPALILTLDDTYVSALQPIGIDFSGSQFRCFCRFTLLIEYAPQSNTPSRLIELPTFYDEYIKMFDGNWLLGGALVGPVVTDVVQGGLLDWEGQIFIGASFRVALPVRVT